MHIRQIGAAAGALAALWLGAMPAAAQSLSCRRFGSEALAGPAPREAAAPLKRFDFIKREIAEHGYPIFFLGDSITEGWDGELWREHFGRRGTLNAGVSGDRTEHLLWRLENGNLAGPPPRLAIVLIGTNDLGHGRPPNEAADGIRAVVQKLRGKLPYTRILLLGLWPRGASPGDRLRREVAATNRLISTCGDNRTVFYADIGGILLDYRGELSRAISPDLLHFSAAGYARLAPLLDRLVDPLLRTGR